MRGGGLGSGYSGAHEAEPHPLETAALWLLGFLVALGALLWVTGELAGRVFGGAWPRVSVAEMGSVVAALPQHAGDPAAAWPPDATSLLPSAFGFYAVLALVLLPTLGISVLVVGRLGNRSSAPGTARWARGHDLRLLQVHRREPGRLILGRVRGQLIAAEPRQSAIVVGPTQTGKTTGF